MKGESTKMSDTEVTLKATLDASGIKNDVAKIQKTLDKQTVSLPAEIDAQKLLKSVQTVLPKVIKELGKIPEIEVPVNFLIDEKMISSGSNYKSIVSSLISTKEAEEAVSGSNKISVSLKELLNVWNKFKNGISVSSVVDFGINKVLEKTGSENIELELSDSIGVLAGVLSGTKNAGRANYAVPHTHMPAMV